MSFDSKALEKIEFIYGSDDAPELLNEVKSIIKKYQFNLQNSPPEHPEWDQEDIILITYGDVILPANGSGNKLQTLAEFLTNRLDDSINTVHILPFFSSSSDMGFSVIDYKEVRDDLGRWHDIENLSKKYKVMADLVINHTSRYSDWFENFQIGKDPGKDYFIEVDPAIDLSMAVRPRSSPLLTAVKTHEGLRYVWTTFSDDQIDLDFTNPNVLLEFIDIFMFYLSKGIRLVRLDAIGYLWKKVGTSSIHLKETHQVVKLFRDIVDYIEEDVALITETNVPFEENVSYFGDGDETHMIYQFSLPPLLLHAILTENAQYLSRWAENLPEPPKGCTYFNFTSSHDGIGVRPIEGLVPEEEFDYLIESTEERGGFISYKQNSDGTQSPYELNITYYDIFAKPGEDDSDLQVKRYLCSQIIALSLQGVPGIYFNNLTATRNHIDGVAQTGEKRAINRKQWEGSELRKALQNSSSTASYIFKKYKEILNIRKKHPAFSPEASQQVLNLGDHFFGLCRTSHKAGETIICISNVSNTDRSIPAEDLKIYIQGASMVVNLLTSEELSLQERLTLTSFETVWLKL